MKDSESEHILVLEDVTKTYQMGKVEVHALRGADLVAAKGDFMVILGPSGSGKTTLLNLIGGIDQCTSGDILVDGVYLNEFTQKDLTQYRRTKIGFVFQFFNLIPTLTARENVELVLLVSIIPGLGFVKNLNLAKVVKEQAR